MPVGSILRSIKLATKRMYIIPWIWVETCIITDLAALWGFRVFPPFLYTFSIDYICCKTHICILYMEKKQSTFNI